jgi:hypothetical protein
MKQAAQGAQFILLLAFAALCAAGAEGKDK